MICNARAQAVQERRFPHERQWHLGKSTGRMRAGIHSAAIMLGITSMCFMGVHIGGMHINKIGGIHTEV